MKTTARCVVAALIVLSGMLPLVSAAADWYVSPTGSDSNTGTRARPFATVMAAQAAAASGDTVYLRGGTYRLTTANITAVRPPYAIVNDITKDGIAYVSADAERPVFDFTAVTPADQRVAAFRIKASHCTFRGFEVTGVRITIADRLTQSEAFRVEGGNGNLFERLAIHDGQAIGWYLVAGSNNRVRNVDAYNNKGLNSFSYGNIDGFGVHPAAAGSTGNSIEGSRAWNNSDDGFDLINAWEAVTLQHNWSFRNGFDVDGTLLGDGNGFKAGGYGRNGSAYPQPVPQHRIAFNLAVDNRSNGFYANHQIGGQTWISNTAINNGRANFDMLSTLADNRTDVPGYAHTLANNLGYGAKVEIANLGAASANTIGRNSFTLPLNATARDFVSLDERQLTRPRQANGNLPVVSFATLAPGSALIDAGADAGEAFNGRAPDLGAFETQ
ncbi:right-handed parallel beta-helix repeat-containing protein [Xanthomonas cucurbitae]|uniref:Right-handed parallel beta-helix repeat-containing protein n=1 Tax=Xanthomonas cucurbitae TaxID=56453 RepID=A0ABY7YBW3_9XANT|nr:right-handed parallel beta-helix repeat-containing protein [Xanthomonas cucurbitae]WDM67496.1 right-handed parallel beta-helix repeat-containing protein [Xanthomonas cucurbitae]WDM71370.1 right-handed parallel beta-helix repeat-containing protein [Xanthomonas cucurbitae]